MKCVESPTSYAGDELSLFLAGGYLDKVLDREPPEMDDWIPLPTQQIEFAENPVDSHSQQEHDIA